MHPAVNMPCSPHHHPVYVPVLLLKDHIQSTADTHGGQTGHQTVVLTASLWCLLLNVHGLLRIHGLWRRGGISSLLLLIALVVALLVALLWIVAALVVVSLVVVSLLLIALLLVALVVISFVSSLVAVDGWGSCWCLC